MQRLGDGRERRVVLDDPVDVARAAVDERDRVGRVVDEVLGGE